MCALSKWTHTTNPDHQCKLKWIYKYTEEGFVGVGYAVGAINYNFYNYDTDIDIILLTRILDIIKLSFDKLEVFL